MGRTKGSKNGFRKGIPLHQLHLKPKVTNPVATRQKLQLHNKIIYNRPEDVLYEQVESLQFPKQEVTESAPLIDKIQDQGLPMFDTNVLRTYRNKNYEKCISIIEGILMKNLDQNKDHYKILLAACYTMLGRDYDKAHSALDEVLASNPTSSHAMYSKGVAFYFDRRYDESLNMLDNAIKVEPGPEMERAKDMRSRIDLERRRAFVRMEKIEGMDLDVPDHIEELIAEIPVAINEQHLPEIEKSYDGATAEPSVLQVHNGSAMKKESSSPKEVKSEQQKENDESSMNVTDSDEVTSTLPSPKPNKDDSSPPIIPETLPKSFKPQTADDYLKKGMELYMSGSLKKSLKMFEKAVKLDGGLKEAEEMGTKTQELLELMDMAQVNTTQKKYQAVVDILTEALEVDSENLHINRPFYFQRGLAFFHLGKNNESLKDYAEFDRINKILSEK